MNDSSTKTNKSKDIGKIEPKNHNFLNTVWKLWHEKEPEAGTFQLFVLYVDDIVSSWFEGESHQLLDVWPNASKLNIIFQFPTRCWWIFELRCEMQSRMAQNI